MKKFNDYADFLMDNLLSDRVAKNTLKGYTWSINRLKKEFDGYAIDSIGPKEIDILKKNSQGLAAASVNLLLIVLKKILTLAVDYNDRIDVPKMEFLTPAVSDKFLTEEESQRLIDFSHHPLRLMVAIALTTGLRRHNIFHLRWDEIQNGVVVIKVKGGKTLSIPLSPQVLEMIERHKKYLLRRKKGLSDWVFPSVKHYENHKPASSDGGLNRVFKKAGLPYSGWHVLRHTFATSFLREVNNIRLLQEILGHADITQTARYAHVAIDQKKEALDSHSQGLQVNKKPIPRCRRSVKA